jgi:hypothetical protein
LSTQAARERVRVRERERETHKREKNGEKEEERGGELIGGIKGQIRKKWPFIQI